MTYHHYCWIEAIKGWILGFIYLIAQVCGENRLCTIHSISS